MHWRFHFLAIASCISTAMASLSYDTNHVDIHASVRDAQVVAQFLFSNTGKTSVGVKSIKTSCGCTTATSDKNAYSPGEKGVIRVVFNIDEKIGLNQKTILVETDDAGDPVHQLTLRAFIPDSVTLDPPSLFWTLQEEPKPKVMKIHVNDLGSLVILRVSSANPSFTSTLKAITPNKEYEISVVPVNTSEPKVGTLLIETSLTGVKKYITATASVGSVQ